MLVMEPLGRGQHRVRRAHATMMVNRRCLTGAVKLQPLLTHDNSTIAALHIEPGAIDTIGSCTIGTTIGHHRVGIAILRWRQRNGVKVVRAAHFGVEV